MIQTLFKTPAGHSRTHQKYKCNNSNKNLEIFRSANNREIKKTGTHGMLRKEEEKIKITSLFYHATF